MFLFVCLFLCVPFSLADPGDLQSEDWSNDEDDSNGNSIFPKASGCSFTLGTSDFPTNPPSLFKLDTNGNYVLVNPVLSGQNGVVSLTQGSSVFVSCQGDGNKFTDTSFTTSQGLVATCADNKLSNGVKAFSLSSLGCSKRTKGNIVKTGSSCAQGKGEQLEIGLNLVSPTSTVWYPLIEVCYNTALSITYYSKHTVAGKDLLAAENESTRPTFVTGLSNLYPNFNPDDVYKQTTQLTTLTNLLGSATLAGSMLNVTYLARGHLAPDNDFIFSGTQYSTYFYSNVAPEWQSVNAGLWLALENAVRDLGKKTQIDYTVYTGTAEVLTLTDSKGKQVEIWLAGNQLPVPKYYWKIMVDPGTKKGMGFVTLNNPFASGQVDWPCTDICSTNGWGTSTWTGKQICCDVREMAGTVGDFPNIPVSGVLTGPRAENGWLMKPAKALASLVSYFKVLEDLIRRSLG